MEPRPDPVELPTVPKASSGSYGRFLVAVVSIAVLVLVSRFLPLKEYADTTLETLRAFGPAGLALLALLYVLACVLLIPGSLLTLGAGFLAATLWPDQLGKALLYGTACVSAGSVGGATLCFLLGRTWLRGWVEVRVRLHPKFQALDEAFARDGLKMVFLLRLSPVFPFNLLNYGLGITKVRLRDYVFASWIGMFPATVVYVYLGTLGGGYVANQRGVGETSPWEYALQALGLVATVVVAFLLARMAKRALGR